MSRKKLPLFLAFVVLFLSVGAIYFINKFNLFFKKPAGLIVNANIPAQVILGKKKLGSTPLVNNKLHPGEYTLLLKPLDQSSRLSTWQTKVYLHRGVATSVHYDFASNPASSSGYILQYEPNSDSNQTTISLISDPDICNISLDKQTKGFTPLKKTLVSVGEHDLLVANSGFQPLELKVSALKGYNLLIRAKLAQALITLNPSLQATASATKSAELKPTSTASPSASISRPYVVIQPTGTGWLRVRSQPSTSGSELGKVNVGEKLKFIQANEVGWYQVIFKGQKAWISGRYAKLYR